MNSFPKEERLCSKKNIDLLYQRGSSFLLYPYRVQFLCVPKMLALPLQVLIAVPKKRFKKAVDRNAIKRKMREVYRLQKIELHPHIPTEHTVLMALHYVGSKIHDYEFLEIKYKKVCEKLIQNIQ